MSTQQDIYAAGSESLPPMLNKENYVPWSSRLLCYAKSGPDGKLIHNSIINGPYVRRMIPEPGDTNLEVPVNETFHVQTDDELTEKELKQIEVDDQAIQTILLGLPEDIYTAIDSYETAQEIWLRVQQMMNGPNIGIQEKKAKLFNEWESQNEKEVDELKAERIAKIQDPLALMANSNNPYAFPAPHQDQPSFNQNYMQQSMPNPEDITDPTTAINMALALMAKAFKLNYSTPTNNNQRISLNPRNRQIAQPGMNMGQDRQMQMVGGNANQNLNGNGSLVAARAEGNAAGNNENPIRCYNYRRVGHFARNCTRISSNPRNRLIAQPGMNMGQDRQMQMVGGNGGNQFRQYVGQNAGNLNGYNAVQNVGNQVAQNPRVQNDGIQNQIGNGNLVAVRAEGNAAGHNGNQIRCYNCRGVEHFARECTVRPRRMDAAYLQTQLLIAQKEEARIQLQAEEYDLMAAAADLDEIEEV
nr:hypothetical protein [Tanacetum cinerariifolium]